MIRGNGNEKAKRKDKYTDIEAATSIFKAGKNMAALTKDNKHIKLIHFFFFSRECNLNKATNFRWQSMIAALLDQERRFPINRLLPQIPVPINSIFMPHFLRRKQSLSQDAFWGRF